MSVLVSKTPKSIADHYWAIPFNMHTPPMDNMVIRGVCLSQGVIQTSTVLGGTVSYFVVSRGANPSVLGDKLLC